MTAAAKTRRGKFREKLPCSMIESVEEIYVAPISVPSFAVIKNPDSRVFFSRSSVFHSVLKFPVFFRH